MRVRFREDVGWEMRCDDCKLRGRSAFYWPLLPVGEFWSARTQIRCQACERERIARYRRRHPTTRVNKMSAAMKARVRYYANRETILRQHRERYAAKKAA